MIAGPNWELHRKAGSCSQTGDKAAREERHRDENFRRKRRDDLIGDAIVVGSLLTVFGSDSSPSIGGSDWSGDGGGFSGGGASGEW